MIFIGIIKAIRARRGAWQKVVLHVTETGPSQKDLEETDQIWDMVGEFMASVGDKVIVEGELKNVRSYGYQIHARKVKMLSGFTDTEEQLHQFLVKHVSGVGPKMADALINEYGVEDLIRLLDSCSPRIIEDIPGIGIKTAEQIWETWTRERFKWDPWKYLTRIGIRDLNHIRKIIGQYGRDTEKIVSKYPYRLLEVEGLSFRTVDAIAIKAGVDPLSPIRIMSAIVYALNRQSDFGHTYYEKEQLKGIVEYLLDMDELDDELYDRCLFRLERSERIVTEADKVFSARIYMVEKSVASVMIELKYGNTIVIDDKSVDDFIKLYQTRHEMEFTKTQQRAIYRAANTGVMVLTGGPGTGKTFTVGAMVELFRSYGNDVVLCSSTGRSARRIKESTGYEAHTIHRLLKVIPNGKGGTMFEHDDRNPLDGDVFIVDEVSMVDLELMHHLLKAIPVGKKLIMIGDKDQLPSIGLGSVLNDCIGSGRIPVVELQTVFRQSETSDIVINANKVNMGKIDIVEGGKDFWWVKDVDEDMILKVITERIPKRFGIPMEDIKVITPYRREYAEVNVKQLNRRLQEIANPEKEIEVKNYDGTIIRKPNGIVYKGVTFRVGDPVMQMENDYVKLIFNGDIGTIVSVDQDEDGRCALLVDFGDDRGIRSYIDSDIDHLELAYAMTVHKSQGSEYPAVVIILPELTEKTSGMLKRNMLYTAITRAQKLCVLFASEASFRKCVNDDSYDKRMTMLARWLVDTDSKVTRGRRRTSKVA